jgi:hypothetical protein
MNRQLSLLTFSSALLLSSSVFAAPPKFAIQDRSSEALIDEAAAKAIWLESLSPDVAKVYPVKKWGYISEVNGGFDESKTCVVVARAMVVPLSPVRKLFLYAPKETSAAFGSIVAGSAEQCSALAKSKLKEAVKSVVSSMTSK